MRLLRATCETGHHPRRLFPRLEKIVRLARNYAAGSLRQKNASDVIGRGLCLSCMMWLVVLTITRSSGEKWA